MSKLPEIIPGILAHSLEEYVDRLSLVEASNSSWVHVDFMDGQFVPNISVMPHEIMSLSSSRKMEAHLMTFSPERYYSDLTVAGVSRILIHREAFSTLEEVSTALRHASDYFNEVGLVLNPNTEVEPLQELKIQEVQCMGVYPGASGQPFIQQSYATIKAVHKQQLPVVLAVDGAVGDDTILELRAAGIERFVITSRLFAGNNITENISHFNQILEGGV